MSGASSQLQKYELPAGVLGLKGPVAKPEPGTLPLRGDLAHIALAGQHLAAHYVIPKIRYAGDGGARCQVIAQDDAETVFTAEAGTVLELLDTEGDWGWVCGGPGGPSGYCKISALAPEQEGS